MIVRLLMIAEFDTEDNGEVVKPEDAEAYAQRRIDHFRESVLPSSEYGVSIYRTRQDDTDMTKDLWVCGWDVLGGEGDGGA
jgi:hypothetical protein